MNGTVDFLPLIPWPVVALLTALGLAMIARAAFKGSGGAVLRTLALGIVALALLNPRIVSEVREPKSDIAVIVVDRTSSQGVGARRADTDKALAALDRAIKRFEGLETRIVTVEDDEGAASGSAARDAAEGGTRLFQALTRAIGEVPAQRFAGAVIVSDGQVHDVPAKPPEIGGPVHVLLTGKPGERDRRLVVDRAPGFGIVGKEVTVDYRVEDKDAAADPDSGRKTATVRFRHDGIEVGRAVVPVGVPQKYTMTLEHAGPTLIEIEVDAAEGELSPVNNRALVKVNGVRDRLRVLLVSGQPHAGERTWRNLLKSDPAVDLVHFTILRPPEKDDFTPLVELALIAFPVQELFEVKLKEFDLIVFDRYVVRDVLPPSYHRNIDNYVRQGGALMIAVGPEFAGIRSLFHTPLGAVMPGTPAGSVFEQGFRPAVTAVGRRHPVTADLPGAAPNKPDALPDWGRWHRVIEGRADRGHVLMNGPGDRPLLILDRVGKGRVAQLMSDHIWLWARGYEGGGPHAELMRRLAHWLMKEPELEEESLTAEVKGGRLTVERRSLDPRPAEVTVTSPSGKTFKVPLRAADAKPPAPGTPAGVAPAPLAGLARAAVPVEETGLYRVEEGNLRTMAAAGALNPLELSDLRATPELLKPLAQATGGGVYWLADGVPDVRHTKPGRDASGRGWIGLRKNDAFVVSGVSQVPLLPGLLVLLLAVGGLMGAWWREGR